MKPLVVVLSIICVALAAQVWLRQGPGNRASQEMNALGATVNSLSNEVRETRLKAGEEAKLAAYLQSNLTVKVTELTMRYVSVASTTAALPRPRRRLELLD